MVTSRRTLAVSSLGTLVTLVAFTAPLATINATTAGLGAGASGRTWILSSMSIGLGALLLTAGRVADDFGRRRTFVAGALVLALGSLGGLLSQDVVWFVLSRIAQGMGGAALVAASLGLIAHEFPAGPARAHATGVWGASVGAGIAVGPFLSAGLDRVGSWRDIYVALLVGGVLLAMAALGLEEVRATHRSALDLPGVVTLGLGVAALLAGLTEGHQGWTRPAVLLLVVAGVLMLGAFVGVERSSTHPMLDLGLFRRPAFLAVTIAALVTGGGVISLLSYLAGFVGAALAIPAWHASWLMLAWSVSSVAAALLARRLPATWSGRGRLAGSLVVVAVGMLLLLPVTPASSAWVFVPGLLVAGIGSGVQNAALGREAVASVPAHQGGLGSGANNTARYLGSALGVTVVSVVAAPSGLVTAASLVDGWHRAVLVTVAVTVVGAVLVALVGERSSAPSGAQVSVGARE